MSKFVSLIIVAAILTFSWFSYNHVVAVNNDDLKNQVSNISKEKDEADKKNKEDVDNLKQNQEKIRVQLLKDFPQQVDQVNSAFESVNKKG